MNTESQEPYTSEDNENQWEVMDNDFILLDDLVYAPLHALAESNQKLQAQIVDAIRSMGTSKHEGQEEIICLNNINVAYDQVRTEIEDGYSVDKMQVQIPLLSIIPVTNLNVEKAEIDFSVEVKAVGEEKTGETRLMARICAPSQRESDFLPRISYKLKIASVPSTEGFLRLTDALNAVQVVQKLDTRPVTVSGDLGSDEQKGMLLERKKLKAKMNRLKQLHQKISDMISDRERICQMRKNASAENPPEAQKFDKDRYLNIQSSIMERILEYQEKIVNIEIEYGLENDYE